MFEFAFIHLIFLFDFQSFKRVILCAARNAAAAKAVAAAMEAKAIALL